MTDDVNGVIYRVAYTGARRAAGPPAAPTNVAGASVRMTGRPVPPPAPATPPQLAAALVGAGSRPLTVSSSAFAGGAPIPRAYSAEGQDVSPPLAWSAGPAGTGSYAVVMADPDVTDEPPFVHWMLYNVPAGVTRLDEGVPGAPKLERPEGALQGANDRGSLGYYGPRPPAGEPAHRYHVQLFALDRVLDLPHGASRAELLAAMRGHVLASGTLTGTFRR